MLDLSGLDIWASKGAAFGLPLLYMPPKNRLKVSSSN
jgi:hypothetical protein